MSTWASATSWRNCRTSSWAARSTSSRSGSAGDPEVVSTGVAADDGRFWTTGGGAEGGPVVVRGTGPALLGWLSGRRDGSALTVDGGHLPVLPPL